MGRFGLSYKKKYFLIFVICFNKRNFDSALTVLGCLEQSVGCVYSLVLAAALFSFVVVIAFGTLAVNVQIAHFHKMRGNVV